MDRWEAGAEFEAESAAGRNGARPPIGHGEAARATGRVDATARKVGAGKVEFASSVGLPKAPV